MFACRKVSLYMIQSNFNAEHSGLKFKQVTCLNFFLLFYSRKQDLIFDTMKCQTLFSEEKKNRKKKYPKIVVC